MHPDPIAYSGREDTYKICKRVIYIMETVKINPSANMMRKEGMKAKGCREG
jgi:hypothetical protein